MEPLNYVNTWADKPYHTLDEKAAREFGKKLYRLSLDGGNTCPNRDGTIGTGGCIFCSEGGSGDFAASRTKPVKEQLSEAKERIRRKLPKNRPYGYIAYFQAYTATYGDINRLRENFWEAIQDPEVEVLSLATRPDCLGEEVLELLSELRSRKPVWVELGLQTIHEASALWMRRGYSLPVFQKAVKELRERDLEVIVHLILGLPGEGKTEVLETVDFLNALPINGVKLQLLHFLKGTDLEKELAEGRVHGLTFEEYEELLFACIGRLREDVVIHRITGDGPRKLLLAPLWTTDKKVVLNTLLGDMKGKGIRQGTDYEG